MKKPQIFQSQKLAKLYQESGLSYFALAMEITKATALMVNPTTMRSHLKGGVPSANHLRAYALYFKKPESYFFTNEEPHAKKSQSKKEGRGAGAGS